MSEQPSRRGMLYDPANDGQKFISEQQQLAVHYDQMVGLLEFALGVEITFGAREDVEAYLSQLPPLIRHQTGTELRDLWNLAFTHIFTIQRSEQKRRNS